jgi:hypothetical protein
MSYPSCNGVVFHECTNLHFILLTRFSTKTSSFNFSLVHPFPPAYLTLAEGCRLNIVEILETGTVGRLSVHNRSPKKPLFI